MSALTEEDKVLWGKLNSQTARIEWSELERYFARGVVVEVAAELDLVEIAVCLVRDSTDVIDPLLKAGKLVKATDDHARDWSARNPNLWAVVAMPWVLVQEKAG